MNRAELERLGRDALITLAEEAGVSRARILTRAELVDELLLRSAADEATKRRSRGLFGVARDLLARVVERGLHLPDAADRIRTMTLPTPPRRSAPAALPTVTLAEIYATQGHRDRAIETLESVLAREPEHAAARALLAQLADADYTMPVPVLPPEPEEPAGSSLAGAAGEDEAEAPAEEAHKEPFGMLDDQPLPASYDVDECVAIPVDPTTVYVYWEARGSTLERLREAAPHGHLSLRVVIVVPTWDGPRSRTVDHDVSLWVGDWFLRDLPAGSVVRTAVGWRSGEAFESVAHSPALETPPGSPSPIVADVLVRWTPAGTSPVRAGDPDAPSIARALGRLRSQRLEAAAIARLRQAAAGAWSGAASSGQWAGLA